MLPIYESFYAWQGEGCHAGRAAYFIRTYGCPVRCPWCDSAGTWHPDWIPERIQRIASSNLAAQCASTQAEFVVVTGGEPAIHDLRELTTAIHQKGLQVHLETSGGFSLHGDFDWITLSPKQWKMPLPENLQRADEIKIIVEDQDSIARWWAKIGNLVKSRHIWLHPEWSQRDNPAVTSSISTWVKQHGAPFRAGFQIHRLYNVDAMDARARPAVPLGGNISLGL